MEEKAEYYNEEEKFALARYDEMLSLKKRIYFDIFELELIIDHYIEQQNFIKAGEAIDYGLNLHPKALGLQQKKAQFLISQGLYTQALKILKAILKIESSNSQVAFLIGVIYSSLGEIRKALVQFDQAIEISSDDSEELCTNAGTSLEQIGQYELAIRYFSQALEINPQNSVALYEMAYCCEKVDKDEESIKYYKEYLFTDPYSRLAWTNLAGVYYKLENYEQSIDAIEFALVIDPSYKFAHFQKGISEIFSNKYAEGIQSLKTFIAENSMDAEAHYYIGEAYNKLGNAKEAIKYFERAIVLDSAHCDAYYGLAMIFYQENKFPDAYYAIKKALKIEPNDADYWHLSALINKNLGFIEDSEKAFKAGIELEHSDPQIWIDYSELENGKKSLFKKINILSQAYEYFSGDAEINYRLAANLALIENVDVAIFHLKEALKSEPGKLDIFRSIYSMKNSAIENLIEKYLYGNFKIDENEFQSN